MWLLEPTICPVIAVSLFCFSLCIQNDLNLHRSWFEVASTMIRCCFERFRKLFENDRCSYPNFMHIKAPNTCVYVCGYNIQLVSVISIYWACASKTIWIWFGSDSNFQNDFPMQQKKQSIITILTLHSWHSLGACLSLTQREPSALCGLFWTSLCREQSAGTSWANQTICWSIIPARCTIILGLRVFGYGRLGCAIVFLWRSFLCYRFWRGAADWTWFWCFLVQNTLILIPMCRWTLMFLVVQNTMILIPTSPPVVQNRLWIGLNRRMTAIASVASHLYSRHLEVLVKTIFCLLLLLVFSTSFTMTLKCGLCGPWDWRHGVARL